jgi:hypothetical protein
MKRFLYEENVKFPARKPAAHIAATSKRIHVSAIVLR